MSDSTDFAVSLPTDTGTFTASSMLPVGLLDTNHVLLLADDVAPDEVEALALSQDIQSGWVGVSSLQLFPGVSLLGPWKVDAEMRRRAALRDLTILHREGPADDLDELVAWSTDQRLALED